MQTRIPSFMMIAFFAILLFSSCSKKSNTQGRYIPKTAALVLQVNGESLTAKLPWAEIKQNELFKELYADSSVASYIKAALDNPENTGIDIKNDISFFVQKDTSGGYAAIEGTIKDAAKFKQFSSDASKTATETEKDGVHFLTNQKMTSAWNKDRFVIVMDAPEMNDINKFRNTYDSASPAPMAIHRDLALAAGQVFSLSADNSLAKNEKFSELISAKADIHFWFNGEAFNLSSMGGSALSMMNMNKLYEGSLVAGTANFENGKIVADIKSYSGKEMTAIWKKYSGSKINTDMVKRVADKDIAVLLALNFKPEGIREFIRLAGVEGFANMGASSAGFTFDDFINANKGDIVFVVSNLKKDSMNKPDANVLFSVSIGDKNAFGKLIDAGKKLGNEKMGAAMNNKIFYNSNENYFAIGNNKDGINKFVSSSASNSFSFLDKISGSPAGAFVNFQYIMATLKPDAVKDSLGYAAYDASLKMWDNLIAAGGEFSNGGVTQHVEITLVDKTTNSLKQLNTYLGTMGSIEKKKKAIGYKWEDKAMKMDSLK